MAKIARKTQKIFGKNAPQNQITTFGSIKDGTPVYSQDVGELQTTAFESGWSAAVTDDYAPYRQDRNAVDRVVTEQLAYLFQEGIPEWDSGTTYYSGSLVKSTINSKIYQAKKETVGREPSQYSDDWGELLAPYQLKSNLSQVIDSSTEKYPSNKAVQDFAVKKDLSNVSSNIDYVVESWTDGISFYRKFKSGWLEQGRFSQTIDSQTNQQYTFTLIRPFKTAQNYEVILTSFGTDDKTTGPNVTLVNRQTTSVTVVNQGFDTGSNHRSFNWYACGQGA